jgi:hypothetical protein
MALTNFKLCLHLDPKNVEALQAVGVLYVLLGDSNTGRHYLRSAVQEWEAKGRNFLEAMKAKEEVRVKKYSTVILVINHLSLIQHDTLPLFSLQLSLDRMGHWVLDYLLSIFSLQSAWKVRDGARWAEGEQKKSRTGLFQATNPFIAGGQAAISRQTPYDFAMLSHFVDSPSLFTPRMHYDLGLSLCELGAWERGVIHMRDFGVKAMKEMGEQGRFDAFGEGALATMRVREALNVPLVLEEGQGEEMWRKIDEYVNEGRGVVTPPIDELQDAVTALPLLHYLGGGQAVAKKLEQYMRASNLELNFVSRFLSLPNILDVSSQAKFLGEEPEGGGKDERIRVAIVSQYFCSHPVGRLALPIIARCVIQQPRKFVLRFSNQPLTFKQPP